MITEKRQQEIEEALERTERNPRAIRSQPLGVRKTTRRRMPSSGAPVRNR
jgi:hypothetical protein